MSKKKRSKAFFISGGAGRVICSIPAFERYAKDSGDKDFIIVCEGGMDFYKGHSLHKHAYDSWHKNLFEEHILDKDIVTPEPYRINEYFTQKCSLAQAFDIEINGLETAREVTTPSINLNKMETISGYQAIQGIKSQLNKDKAIIVQPFGRSVQQMGEYLIDSTSRSFEVGNIIAIIEELRKKYAVIIMADLALPIPENKEHPIAMPREPNLRLWAGMMNSADHFLGCDSLGQHIVKALDKTATVVIGSTVPINISYPENDKFDILDIGNDKGRIYSPIRVTYDELRDRINDQVMMLNDEETQKIVESCEGFLGDGGKFTGQFIPTHNENTCTNPDHNHNPVDIEKKMIQIPTQEQRENAKYDFDMNNLLTDTNKDESKFVSPFGTMKPAEEK